MVTHVVWCSVRILTRLCRTRQGVRNLFKSKVKTFQVFKLLICPTVRQALKGRLVAALGRMYQMARVGALALFQAVAGVQAKVLVTWLVTWPGKNANPRELGFGNVL